MKSGTGEQTKTSDTNKLWCILASLMHQAITVNSHCGTYVEKWSTVIYRYS